MFTDLISFFVKMPPWQTNFSAWCQKLHFACLRYLHSRHAATSVEYAMILAGIAVALILVFTLIGNDLANIFGGIDNQMTAAQATR